MLLITTRSSDEERYENEAMSWPAPTENGHSHQYQTTTTTTGSDEVEKDNPFRPGGELSREAEIIVRLIKEGKPLVPYIYENGHMKNGDLTSSQPELGQSQATATQQHSSPSSDKTDHNSNARRKGGAQNGKSKESMSPNGSHGSSGSKRGEVEVTHGIVIPPNGASQTVEQVHIKSKGKHCCVIQ